MGSFWRSLFFLLAIPVAWYYGPEVIDGLGKTFPFLAGLFAILFPDFQGRAPTDYLKVALAVVFLWWLTRAAGVFFGFALPQAQRYTTTKSVRRLQGVCGEVFVFSIFAGLVLWALMANGNVRERWLDRQVEVERRDNLQRASTVAASETETRRAAAKKALEALFKTEDEYLDKFKQSGAEKVSRGVWLPKIFLDPSDRKRVADSNYEPNYFEKRIPQSHSGVDAATFSRWRQQFKQQVAIPYEEELDALLKKAQDTEWALDTALSGQSSRPEAPTDPATRRGVIWSSMSPPARIWVTLTNGGYAAVLMFALPLYLALGWALKRLIARLHPKLLRFVEAGRFGFGGSARFATLIEEWALRWRAGSPALFMGRSLYSRLLHVGLKDARHMLTIAGSRAGKGTSAIIPNLLMWQGSALVIDPKGTNAAVTAAHRRAMGQDVHIVDPFNVLGQGSASFNPLAHLDPAADDIREQIGVIADAIVVADADAREKHWDEGARTIISGLIAHLVSSYQNPTLPHVRDLLTLDDEDQRALWAKMSEDRDAGGGAREAANRVIRGYGTNEITGIISNADKHTEWLASVAIAKVLSASTFSFADLKTKPTTVYLILPPHYLEEHKRFLRLFINLAIRQMSVGGRSNVPVLMILDEFLALGHMGEVEKAFGLMAGYNFVLWPFVQDLGRLRDLYKNSVNAFIANSRAVQVFGIADEETTKFVCAQVGERTMAMLPGTQQLRTVPLRTPTEVAKDLVVDGEGGSEFQYILRAGKAPLILEKVRYFEDRDRSGRTKPLGLTALLLRRRLFPFAGLYSKDPDFQ